MWFDVNMSKIARRITRFSEKEFFEYNFPTNYSSAECHRVVNNIRINAGAYILNMDELDLDKKELKNNIPEALRPVKEIFK